MILHTPFKKEIMCYEKFSFLGIKWRMSVKLFFKSDRKITFICYSSICDFTASLTPIIVDKYSKKKTK